MTKEEAKKLLYKYTLLDETYPKDDIEAFEVAIKALEQEPILDKIRGEIKKLSPEFTAEDSIIENQIKGAIWETLIDVLRIIERYKTESEE